MLPSGVVTFVFTDIEAATRLAQRLGEGYRPVLDQCRRVLHRTLRANQGVAVSTLGDSSLVAFEDAAAALHACRAAQQALAATPWPDPAARPRVRIGLHSGRARPSGGEYASLEVHRAQRVTAAAHGGQVLCSEATARSAEPLPEDLLLRDLGLHRLRGFDGAERLFQLAAADWAPVFPHPRAAAAAPHNLPAALTPFLGRVREQAQLAALLAEHRMVTVTGPRGAGKSRLAARVAAARLADCPDGVWWIDLPAVARRDPVPAALATTLGLRLEPGRPVWHALRELLARRRLLLVVDGCDVERRAVAQLVSGLAAGGHGVRVLATARQRLGIPAEVAWPIPPLSFTPGPGGPGEAVALLADRVAAARGGVPVPRSELADLARIAERLGGVPGALERAAGQLRAVTAAELAARLERPRIPAMAGAAR